MDVKEKLIKFIQLKNEIIEKETGLKYIVQEDIDDIKKWNEKECNNVYDDLDFFIHSNSKVNGLTEYTCIWCFKHFGEKCEECDYGLRHGICRNDGSLFNKYKTKEVKALFTNEVYVELFNQMNTEEAK